ncbi:MAG: helix-turn-helix transcriptional regulator [Bacteroidales bacterium]|nr:helix-turn-helix transcriptional regulator [Bacteroidales bacterium]
MKKVKVYIEIADNGYSAYMENNDLDYGLIGEGETVEKCIADFKNTYESMKAYYSSVGKNFQEASFEFYYDTASFLEEYSRAFSLAGLERITGVSQAQLGHYLHGRRKPSQKTVNRIQQGVKRFAENLIAVRFA